MKLSEVARQYLGQTEKPSNSGFNDLEFEMKMAAVGWQKSHAWCAYFAELVAKETYPEKHQQLDKLFSASAVQTFKNFKDEGYTISSTPVKDSVVVWQNYKDGKAQWSGHVGIVSNVLSDTSFQSIEGNTSDSKSREGYIVAEHTRSTASKKTGLNVLGFIVLE